MLSKNRQKSLFSKHKNEKITERKSCSPQISRPIDTETLTIEDNMIELSKNNITDITDFGIYGKYNDNPAGGGSDNFAGLFRDADDGKFNLFKDWSYNK